MPAVVSRMRTRSAMIIAFPLSGPPCETAGVFFKSCDLGPMIRRPSLSLGVDGRRVRVEIDDESPGTRPGRRASDDVVQRVLIEVILRALELPDRDRVHRAARIRVRP